MPRKREHSLPVRQLYASIREDIYLAAKAAAAERQQPMRRFIEDALVQAISTDTGVVEPSNPTADAPAEPPSIWDDHHLAVQARQPLGSALDLSDDDARKVALAAFGAAPAANSMAHPPEPLLALMDGWRTGDELAVSDEEAASIALTAFGFANDSSDKAHKAKDKGTEGTTEGHNV